MFCTIVLPSSLHGLKPSSRNCVEISFKKPRRLWEVVSFTSVLKSVICIPFIYFIPSFFFLPISFPPPSSLDWCLEVQAAYTGGVYSTAAAGWPSFSFLAGREPSCCDPTPLLWSKNSVKALGEGGGMKYEWIQLCFDGCVSKYPSKRLLKARKSVCVVEIVSSSPGFISGSFSLHILVNPLLGKGISSSSMNLSESVLRGPRS